MLTNVASGTLGPGLSPVAFFALFAPYGRKRDVIALQVPDPQRGRRYCGIQLDLIALRHFPGAHIDLAVAQKACGFAAPEVHLELYAVRGGFQIHIAVHEHIHQLVINAGGRVLRRAPSRPDALPNGNAGRGRGFEVSGIDADFQLPGVMNGRNRAAVSPEDHIRVAVFRLEPGRPNRKLRPLSVQIKHRAEVAVTAEVDRLVHLAGHPIAHRYVNFLH